MPDFFANDISSRFGPEGWMQDNDRGLALAADGDWGEACEAFAAAADALARSLPSTRGHHEPLALILSNLAQANFRVGRLDEALQHAQRVCALRVAIAGEDAMPVARARMDLAVLLASRGRVDEARTLVQRAIYAVEHHVGEDDARLAIVLENAARIALVAGSPANAEPLLIRLHALLDAHDMSTTRAEQLLARVATARSRQQRHAAAERPVATVALETPETQSAFEGDLESRVYAHASIEAHDEWDDQPLRDAVAVTDVLLRTTPCGVPLIPVSTPIEPPLLIAEETVDLADIPDPFDAFANFSFDLADSAPAAHDPVPVPVAAPFAGPLDAMDLSLATPLSIRAEADPIDLPVVDSGLMLDFTVAHGVIDDMEEAPLLQAPPVSSPFPDALPEMPSVIEPPTVSAEPTTIVSSGSTRGIAPMADMVGTSPPLTALTPSPHSAPVAPLASTEQPTRRTAEERVVMPASAKATSGSGKLIAIIAGALAAAGGAAAYFLLK
ncbi:tetratricopeptide repeat protein [Gemmatimonas sp.]|jgi:tetratricopeptide (TPR) repeat protein|uniref:tetratricopeptide repeat protein n=2 Tax=Gemmatimonas sp. TaxID=1962908 RepID=UPI0037C10CE8